MKAIWNNQVIAESDNTVVVEGNHYFPPDSVKMEFLKKSGNTYHCHWKGLADYYNVVIGEQTCADCAWIYPEPTQSARRIKGYVAFWRGVEIKK